MNTTAPSMVQYSGSLRKKYTRLAPRDRAAQVIAAAQAHRCRRSRPKKTTRPRAATARMTPVVTSRSPSEVSAPCATNAPALVLSNTPKESNPPMPMKRKKATSMNSMTSATISPTGRRWRSRFRVTTSVGALPTGTGLPSLGPLSAQNIKTGHRSRRSAWFAQGKNRGIDRAAG